VLEIDDKFSKKYSEYDLKMYAAVGYYKERLMTTGDLAKIVGLSRIKFINEMHKYGAGICDMNENELEMELQNAKKYLSL